MRIFEERIVRPVLPDEEPIDENFIDWGEEIFSDEGESQQDPSDRASLRTIAEIIQEQIERDDSLVNLIAFQDSECSDSAFSSLVKKLGLFLEEE